ncbi:adenylate kinase [bacterium]|nr:adenylate kinase [bacterium]
MNLVILGKPGAGKGTLCQYCVKKANLCHISTGDIFRQEISAKTPLGILADSYISKGNLCPDSVTNEIIKNILLKDPSRSYLFDGYPRTVNQADALAQMMNELGIKLDAVIDMNVSDEIVIERLSTRRLCRNCGAIYNTRNHMPKVEGKCDLCGGEIYTRDDDQVDAIKERLSVYKSKTQPLIDYYTNNGLIMIVDGSLHPRDLYQVIKNNLDERNL